MSRSFPEFLAKLPRAPFPCVLLIVSVFAAGVPVLVAQEAQGTADEGQLVVATWNICHARGSMKEPIPSSKPEERDKRLREIVTVLKKHRPHLVVLNECSFDSTLVGGENQAAMIGRELDLPHRVELDCSGIELGQLKHHWGNAVLSKFPIADSSEINLPAPKTWDGMLGIKRKGALKVRIQINPQRVIHLIAVHLPTGKDAPSLQLQGVKKLLELYGESNEPWLIAGDFNADWLGNPPGSCIDWLVDQGWQTGVGKIDRDRQKCDSIDWTFPASQPRRSIDWVMSSAQWKTRSRVVPESDVSDHRPVIQTFELVD